jgi:para-nitrobenzyl esterase
MLRHVTLRGLLVVLFAATCVHAVPVPVQTESGWVQGWTTPDGLVDVWTGVPYAAPPVGPLRLRKPLPHAPWSGVFDASKPSSDVQCIQLLGQGQEDCLLLNVFAPTNRTAAAKPLAVFLWIHGACSRYTSSAPASVFCFSSCCNTASFSLSLL